jgi:hypothetical protein
MLQDFLRRSRETRFVAVRSSSKKGEMLQDFLRRSRETRFVAVRSSSKKGEILLDFLRRSRETRSGAKSLEVLALEAIDPR